MIGCRGERVFFWGGRGEGAAVGREGKVVFWGKKFFWRGGKSGFLIAAGWVFCGFWCGEMTSSRRCAVRALGSRRVAMTARKG